jgi:transposase
MHSDSATQAYLARRRADRKSDREIRRCLKRYIARQLYRILTGAMNPNTAANA